MPKRVWWGEMDDVTGLGSENKARVHGCKAVVFFC